MTAEPTITCPSCRKDIKLTEFLAAPLLAATKDAYEKRLQTQAADFVETFTTLGEDLAKEKRMILK